MDVVAVEAAARRAVQAIRVEASRIFSSFAPTDCAPIPCSTPNSIGKVGVGAWRQREPIVRFRGWLEANHMIHSEEEARIEAEVAAEIGAAVAFAEAGTWEPVEHLTRFTYAEKAV